jgi:hypothetical protein
MRGAESKAIEKEAYKKYVEKGDFLGSEVNDENFWKKKKKTFKRRFISKGFCKTKGNIFTKRFSIS